MSSGASTPPEVPDPSDTAQITDLTMRMLRIKVRVVSLCSSLPMTSYPTPSAGGKMNPPTPTTIAPMAGHHIQ